MSTSSPRFVRPILRFVPGAAFAIVMAAAQGADAQGERERAMIEAGRRLFFDVALSEPPGTACSSCHDPARAFTGDNGSGIAVPRGSRPHTLGTRNAPTVMYLATSPGPGLTQKDGKAVPTGGFFWDGRAATLAQQALGPLFSAHEMNNKDMTALVAKVAASDAAPLLKRAYGPAVFENTAQAAEAITSALMAFEQSPALSPFTSKFDTALRGQARLTEQEERGRSLFVIAQKGNCAFCHTMNPDSRDPRDSLFTDFTFHAVGVPRNLDIAKPGVMDQGHCDSLPVGTFDRSRWCGWFKTPTLRNVALTAPYMHNGRFKTLRDAVAFYATRDTNPQRWYPGEKFDDLPPELRGNVDVETRPYHRKPGQRPALSEEEIDDIVAFLQTLTDGYAP